MKSNEFGSSGPLWCTCMGGGGLSMGGTGIGFGGSSTGGDRCGSRGPGGFARRVWFSWLPSHQRLRLAGALSRILRPEQAP
jgi:hypothetical protein